MNIVSNKDFEDRRKAKAATDKAETPPPCEVTDDKWEGFSPETKADSVANDVSAAVMGSLKSMGIDLDNLPHDADIELIIIHEALGRLMNWHFGVGIDKEGTDGK